MDTAAAYDEAAYLREALRKERALRQAEIQRCGRAEGEVGVLREMLRNREAELSRLKVELSEANGLLGDVRDERDALEAQIHGDGR